MTPSRAAGEAPVLVAPDSFKGTFSAEEVAAAVARGVRRAGMPARCCPLADGGEGTVAALVAARGGHLVSTTALDPLGRPVEARFGVLDGGRTAVVETAAASGMALVAAAERDAERASTYGTGQLIVAAARAGAATILVGAGGSATTDGGAGCLAAIRDAGGLGDARLVVLCDVTTPWERAAPTFAPQKGADPEQVERLARRLDRLAEELPRDPRGVPGSGCAGGLAGGLWALGAELVPGADHVLDALDVDRRIASSSAVVTGEGRLDAQTAEGKLVSAVLDRARGRRPAYGVVGVNDLDDAGVRALGMAGVWEAPTLAELERAGSEIALAVRAATA